MSETNINAFKAELEVARVALDRARSRFEELKTIVEAAEDKPVPTEVEVEPEVVKAKVKKALKKGVRNNVTKN